MPKITLNKERVLKLVGKKVSDKELLERIPYLGTDLEAVNENIEVEIFPNRPDMLSLEGFSRSLSSFLKIKTGLREYTLEKGNFEVFVNKNLENIRPYTVCCVVKGLKIDKQILEDIIEMQEKLHVTHGRNRKKCAIGVYPLDKIKFPINYEARAPKDIEFIPLGLSKKMNGSEILLNHEKGKQFAHLMKDKYPIFIDSNKEILSMPPIINSAKVGAVTVETKDVFIECSGTDMETISKALNIIVTSLIDIGGKAFSVNVIYGKEKIVTPNFSTEKIKINFDNVINLIGIKLTDKEIIESLEKMGYSYNKGEVKIPCYRADILHEVDIIEDIAIGYGYDKINGETTKVFTPGKEDFLEVFKKKIRDILIGAGLIENVSYNILKNEIQKKYFNEILEIKNSSTAEYNALRKSVVLSLLNNLELNKKNSYPQNIFEIGRVFSKSKQITENDNIAVALAGEEADYTKIKSYLDIISISLGVSFEIEKTKHPLYIEGRVAKILLNKKEIGLIGEINPLALKDHNLFVPVSTLEINLNLLQEIIF
jgi:phenylalanyl-tRNA synthetase beta chain